MASRALVDTNILISLYNEGRFADEFFLLNRRVEVLFSVVSINEFVRGAHDAVSREIAKSFLDIVRDNLVTPTEAHWIECGRISERLLKGGKRTREKVLLLQNDILIALGARDTDATLVTADRKDFVPLKEWIKFPVEFW